MDISIAQRPWSGLTSKAKELTVVSTLIQIQIIIFTPLLKGRKNREKMSFIPI